MTQINNFLKFSLLLIATAYVSIFFTSCSIAQLQDLFTKKIDLDYKKPENYDQLSKYQKDAIYTAEMVKQSYPRLNTKVEKFDSLSQAFISKTATINNDFDFSIELRNFLALLEDGHSSHSINYDGKEVFNISLFQDNEEWVVANIDRNQDSLIIGSKILSINGKDISDVIEIINRVEAGENKYYRLKRFSKNISKPIYLESAEIIGNNEDLSLEVYKNGKTQTITIERDIIKEKYNVKRKKPKYPFAKKQNNGFYDYFDKENDFAYLQMNTCIDYVAVESEIANYTNALIRPIALKVMKKHQKDAMNFGQFLQNYFSKVEEESIQNIIIDLRYNVGGDERLGKQLIWYLTERKDITGFTDYEQNSKFYRESMPEDYEENNNLYIQNHGVKMPEGEINSTKEFYNNPYFYDIENPDSVFELDSTITKFKGKIYVLIGTGTFSAAQILATTMSDNGIGTLVGCPTGNKPTCQTGFASVKLPYTKKIVTLSITYMERPDKSKNDEKALFPDIEIPNNFMESYVNNIDQNIEYIIEEININEKHVQK